MVPVWVWIVIWAIVALVLSGWTIYDYINSGEEDDSPEIR